MAFIKEILHTYSEYILKFLYKLLNKLGYESENESTRNNLVLNCANFFVLIFYSSLSFVNIYNAFIKNTLSYLTFSLNIALMIRFILNNKIAMRDALKTYRNGETVEYSNAMFKSIVLVTFLEGICVIFSLIFIVLHEIGNFNLFGLDRKSVFVISAISPAGFTLYEGFVAIAKDIFLAKPIIYIKVRRV